MLNNVKIMVVEDDPLIRDLIVTVLTYCVNREVLSFDRSELAWEYIQKGGEIDMIISKSNMPDMNGFELMNRVREQHLDKIFIIASEIFSDEERSLKAGADAFLAKPFEINDLFSIVQCFVVD